MQSIRYRRSKVNKHRFLRRAKITPFRRAMPLDRVISFNLGHSCDTARLRDFILLCSFVRKRHDRTFIPNAYIRTRTAINPFPRPRKKYFIPFIFLFLPLSFTRVSFLSLSFSRPPARRIISLWGLSFIFYGLRVRP